MGPRGRVGGWRRRDAGGDPSACGCWGRGGRGGWTQADGALCLGLALGEWLHEAVAALLLLALLLLALLRLLLLLLLPLLLLLLL